eukprot:5485295-Pyramimonas_sp.AAC.1
MRLPRRRPRIFQRGPAAPSGAGVCPQTLQVNGVTSCSRMARMAERAVCSCPGRRCTVLRRCSGRRAWGVTFWLRNAQRAD